MGDNVCLRIPKIDCTSTDLHRLPCVVICLGVKCFLYRLRCEYGVLDTCYPESELEAYNSSLELETCDFQSLPKISLGEASKLANPANSFYGTFCSCKKGCLQQRCSCRQAGKPCTTWCHSGRSCTNSQDEVTSPVCSRYAKRSLAALTTQQEQPVAKRLRVTSSPTPPLVVEECPSPPQTKWWVQSLGLTQHAKVVLESGQWLSDQHISAAQALLEKQFPVTGGFQCTLLGSLLQFSPFDSASVQILNFDKHWVCISTLGCIPGHVNVYDSIYSTPTSSLLRKICNLLCTKESTLTVHMMDIQKQEGGSDCGCFAIACATTLCYGENPCQIRWQQEEMRTHLGKCFTINKLTLFPSVELPRQLSQDIKQTLNFPVFCT